MEKFPIPPMTARVGFDLHITLAMAVTGLLSIVDRFGDEHKNDGACVYVATNFENHILKPVCIVGQFFHDLGILRALISPSGGSGQVCDGYSNLTGLIGNTTIDYLQAQHGITFSSEALTFLRKAQTEQDAAFTWHDAVNTAAQTVLDARGEVYLPPAQRLADILSREPECQPLAPWERQLLEG